MDDDNLILVKNDEGIEFYLSEDYGEEDLRRCQEKSVQMMSVIVDIFEAHNIDYIIAHGTLLGLIRHNDFIPWDDDCDLFVFDWDYARAIELLRRELPDDMIVHNRRTDPIYWPKWTKIRDLYSDTYESMWKIDRKFRYHGICVDVLKVRVVTKKIDKNAEEIKRIKKRINKRKKKYESESALGQMKYLPRYLAGNSRDNKRLKELAEEKPVRKKICIGNPDTIIECSFDYDDVFPVKKMTFRGVEVAVPKNPEGVLTSMYGDFMSMPDLENRRPHFEKVVFLDEERASQG